MLIMNIYFTRQLFTYIHVALSNVPQMNAEMNMDYIHNIMYDFEVKDNVIQTHEKQKYNIEVFKI